MVKAIIFDLDDTLISEKEYIKSGYHHISEVIEKGFDINKTQIFNDLMALFTQSPQNIFNRFYDKYDIKYSEEMIIALVNEYRAHFPDIQFYDDVRRFLNGLRKTKIKIGIITDGYAVAQRQKLKAVEADKYFDEIIVTDEIGRDYWKPHPRAFELMKDKMEVDFEEMIYVGDNPEKDFYISTVYPIKTVRIMRKDLVHSSKPYYKCIEEDFRIRTLDEIKNIYDF